MAVPRKDALTEHEHSTMDRAIVNIIWQYAVEDEALANIPLPELQNMLAILPTAPTPAENSPFPIALFAELIKDRIAQQRMEKLKKLFPGEKFESQQESNWDRYQDFLRQMRDKITARATQWIDAKSVPELQWEAKKDAGNNYLPLRQWLDEKDFPELKLAPGAKQLAPLAEQSCSAVFDLMQVYCDANPENALAKFQALYAVHPIYPTKNESNMAKAKAWLLVKTGVKLSLGEQDSLIDDLLSEISVTTTLAEEFRYRDAADEMAIHLCFRILNAALQRPDGIRMLRDSMKDYQQLVCKILWKGWYDDSGLTVVDKHLLAPHLVEQYPQLVDSHAIAQYMRERFYDERLLLTLAQLGVPLATKCATKNSLVADLVKLYPIKPFAELVKLQRPELPKLMVEPDIDGVLPFNRLVMFSDLLDEKDAEYKTGSYIGPNRMKFLKQAHNEYLSVLDALLTTYPQLKDEKFAVDPIRVAVKYGNSGAIATLVLVHHFPCDFRLFADVYLDDRDPEKYDVTVPRFMNCFLAATARFHDDPKLRPVILEVVQQILPKVCLNCRYQDAAKLFEKFPEIVQDPRLQNFRDKLMNMIFLEKEILGGLKLGFKQFDAPTKLRAALLKYFSAADQKVFFQKYVDEIAGYGISGIDIEYLFRNVDLWAELSPKGQEIIARILNEAALENATVDIPTWGHDLPFQRVLLIHASLFKYVTTEQLQKTLMRDVAEGDDSLQFWSQSSLTARFLTRLAELKSCDINKPLLNGASPLSHALKFRKFNLATMLIENGADTKFAFAQMVKNKDTEAASWLLARGVQYEYDAKEFKTLPKPDPKVDPCTAMLRTFAFANEQLKNSFAKDFAKMLVEFKALNDTEKLQKFMQHKPGLSGKFSSDAKGVVFLQEINPTVDIKEVFRRAIQRELMSPKPDIYHLCKLRFWQENVLKDLGLQAKVQAAPDLKDVGVPKPPLPSPPH